MYSSRLDTRRQDGDGRGPATIRVFVTKYSLNDAEVSLGRPALLREKERSYPGVGRIQANQCNDVRVRFILVCVKT